MPYRSMFERIVDKLVDLYSIGRYFDKKAILITPKENTYIYKIVRYREDKNEQGIKTLLFENGFYTIEPDGVTQYAVIDGQPGAVFGFDGNVLWNVQFNEKEKAISLMTSTNAERYITFQLFKEIKDRYTSNSEMQKYFTLSLIIIFITGLVQTIMAYFIWNQIGNATGSGVIMSNNLVTYEKMQLTRIAIERNMSFPEYGIYPENYTQKKKESGLIPQVPSVGEIPKFPI